MTDERDIQDKLKANELERQILNLELDKLRTDDEQERVEIDQQILDLRKDRQRYLEESYPFIDLSLIKLIRK